MSHQLLEFPWDIDCKGDIEAWLEVRDADEIKREIRAHVELVIASVKREPQWLPIESAPKDGTPIHCGWFDMPLNLGCNMRAVKFHMGAWWECNEDFKLRPPTHWMPLMLPPPPPIKDSLTTDSGENK